MEKNLGHATAYGYAKSKGYTGTEEEFGVLMASYASVAQDASQSASSAAESAQLASNEAQRASQSATSAHNDAETASNIKTDVESARDTTVDAKNATVEAKNISVEAKNSAISAKDTAESKAQIAEAWAVGQKDGTDVPSTDETYHNNAKYYSEQADIAKIGAESAQQLAQASATSASESVSDASTSAQTASQAAQTATSKASEAVTAAGTATIKASEASTSAGTASTAAQTATNKASEATTAATTATTKASEASQSATSANTAKINAETARDAAAQSASEAANSAIEAAQSAQSVDAERLNRVAFGSYVTESASGSIASFPDGADSIPMKDVLVHIEPVQEGSGDPSPDNIRPITGWTGAKVTRCGKNLCESLFSDGKAPSVSGGALVNANNACRSNYIPISGGNVTFSCKNISSRTIYCFLYGENKDFLLYTTSTLNSVTATHADAKYAMIRCDGGVTAPDESMLELGSTATDYEPYSGQTYDITFPSEAGTVYGGTLDVTNGDLVVDRVMADSDAFQSGSWTMETTTNGNVFSRNAIIGKTLNYNFICNKYKNAKTYRSNLMNGEIGCYNNTNARNRFSICDNRFSTVEDFRASLSDIEIIYELATPITYHLTPQEITSLLGENNVWADTGDSEVEYRVDPALLLDNELSEVQSMIAGVESSAVATKNYSIGDLVIVGSILYEVTAAIASEETISASNTVATTVDNVIKNRMTTVDNTIRNRIADSIDDTLTQNGQAADAKAVGDKIDSLKEDLTNVNNVIFTETDNQIDFTQDFDKWEQGYPNGSQRYAIHLNEKITAYAGDVVYGRIKPITLDREIWLNIRPYNSNNEALTEGYNVANTNNGSWPYTLPEGTAYYYISLTTSSGSYPITPTSVKALNLEIYCGSTNVTEDNIYPKYESIDYKISKVNSGFEEIKETVANNSEYGTVSAIDSGENVHFFGPYEKSYTVVSTSDNWKTDSYVIIKPEFSIGDYVAIKCESYHGYGINGLSIICRDANNANTLSVILLRDQLDENGFITKYFQIPANTTSVTCTLYGVSNTSALPDADKPIVDDVTIIKGAYAIVAKSVPQIDPLFRIDEQPETLWNEEDDTRENHENVYSPERIGYIFLTDLHVDYEDNPTGTAFQKNQLKIACDIANCSDIDFLVLGGDYIDGKGTRATATKWMRWITAGLKTINKPVIVCRGNHDKNNNANPQQDVSEQISTEAFYAIMQAPFRRPEYVYDDNASVPELYFYYDIPEKKTRIIAYDSIFCDNPDEQIKWICEQALNKPDVGWKFIIVTHVPFNNQYNTGGMSWVAQYGAQMEGIITALNNRTTYTGTARTYSISVDFTAYQSSVICISTGHEHTGLITWDSDTDCFFTTTGCGSANAGYGTFNDSSVVRDDAQTTGRNNMAFDNPLKYCFDILSVSANSTTRSRFGNGVDKMVNKP